MRFGIQMMAADAGMDTTCPSPEIPNDSRKRPLDAESDNGSTKRSHFSGESQAKHTKTKNQKKSLVDVEKDMTKIWYFDDIWCGVTCPSRANQKRKKNMKKDK